MMTKERPILFTSEMVCAILDGRKTQTRRVMKVQGSPDLIDASQPCFTCPHGQVGDRLWVRETWTSDSYYNNTDEEEIVYRASNPDYQARGGRTKWRPCIFMPRNVSRITLVIRGIGAERLQEITEEDAKAEGVSSLENFRFLWESINGNKYPWKSNPWVWIIDFNKIV